MCGGGDFSPSLLVSLQRVSGIVRLRGTLDRGGAYHIFFLAINSANV